MRLFLVRHGETVDNVAGIYAGVRDSPLTAHGVLQAKRLATYLAIRSSTIGPVQHVLSSDLQRAADTAQAIVDAQISTVASQPWSKSGPPTLVQSADLRERNFGSAEGQRFGFPRDDAETHDEMRVRAERFINNHLDPLLADLVLGTRPAASVVVVSHGILLNSLLKALLARYAPSELARLAQPGPAVGQPVYLASWSNTGYVEAVIGASSPSPGASSTGLTLAAPAITASPTVPAVTLSVARVNAVDHLDGLKKTRGGIGSAQFDRRQRTVDSFFRPVAKD
ncbi:phosphoglycerate mutase [Rhypophila decipiens]|uniref:Phosphoglycerate mutase n=1 Tax=Rhypophila decipiens TaxID=261697 RepID=A0AAN6YBH4_9PEZI|nr:phosphoglycerate mutase [Rhypophila decipiens]